MEITIPRGRLLGPPLTLVHMSPDNEGLKMHGAHESWSYLEEVDNEIEF